MILIWGFIEKYEKLNLRISIFNNISVLTLTDIGAICYLFYGKFAKCLVRVWNRDKKKMSSMFAPLRFGNCRVYIWTRTFLFCTRSYTILFCVVQHVILWWYYAISWHDIWTVTIKMGTATIQNFLWETKWPLLNYQIIGLHIPFILTIMVSCLVQVDFFSKPRACKYGFCNNCYIKHQLVHTKMKHVGISSKTLDYKVEKH